MRGDEKELYTQQYLSPQLGNLLEFISVQQKRIADAQEKKADAEERKAEALQKRAEAHKLMADALNKIADALYGRYNELTPDEKQGGIIDNILHTPVDTSPALETLSETTPETQTTDEEAEPETDETVSAEDASLEIEQEVKINAASEEAVDENAEIEEIPAGQDKPDAPHEAAAEPETAEDAASTDEKKTPDIQNSSGDQKDIPHDDMSSEALGRETIPNDYKSKIISRIITLKEKKGFSIDATVSYLNEKGFKPIASEGSWDRDMVSKIFSHINTVRKNREG